MDPSKSVKVTIAANTSQQIKTNNYTILEVYSPTVAANQKVSVLSCTPNGQSYVALTAWKVNADGSEGALLPTWNDDGTLFDQRVATFDIAGMESFIISNAPGSDAEIYYQLSNGKLNYPSYNFLALQPAAGQNQPIIPISSTNPLPVTAGAAGLGSVKGQYAFLTDVSATPTAVFPFITGGVNASGQVFFGTSMDPNTGLGKPMGLSTDRARQDQLNFSVIPGSSSTQTLYYSKEMITFWVNFNSAGDEVDVTGAIYGIPIQSVTPKIYNLQSGLPTTTLGVVDQANDGPGAYFFYSEGFYNCSFAAPGGNAGNVDLWFSGSQACRPAMTPIQTFAEIPTFVASFSGGFTPAATATDMIVLAGANGYKIKIANFVIWWHSTAGAPITVYWLKRSAVNTGGTFVPVTPTKFDSLDTVQGSVGHYTANPAGLGASAGELTRFELTTSVIASAASVQSMGTPLSISGAQAKAVTLNSASELLCLNFNGAAVPAGSVVYYNVEYTVRPI